MKIRMYDVNFGEAIVYSEHRATDEKLLVDCGAKYGRKGIEAANQVIGEIGGATCSLVITHFDEDHYNGIIALHDHCPILVKFKKIYLPLYIYQGKVTKTEEVFRDSIKSLACLAVLGRKSKLTILQKLFVTLPKMVNSVSDIQCVGYPDYFHVGGDRYDVLWPEQEIPFRHVKRSTELLRIIAGAVRGESYYERDSEAETEGAEEIDEVLERFTQAFLRLYSYYALSADEREVYDGDEAPEDLIRAETEAYDAVMSLNVIPDKSWARRINSISSALIKSMNECSIVLKQGENVLALGDVSARVIKYLRHKAARLDDFYRALKAPHHGTKSLYYSKDIPGTQNMLISNSGTVNPGWKICEEYYNTYGTGICICTNNFSLRCNALQSGKTPCARCNLRNKPPHPVREIVI